jgi:hypothetical protein
LTCCSVAGLFLSCWTAALFPIYYFDCFVVVVVFDVDGIVIIVFKFALVVNRYVIPFVWWNVIFKFVVFNRTFLVWVVIVCFLHPWRYIIVIVVV